MNNLYHVHRIGNNDNLWYIGSELIVDDNFDSSFYTKLLVEDKKLTKRYGDYDIDYIIAMMEEIKYKNLVADNVYEDFVRLLNRYYFLRREKALEEGRKIYAPNAPSRLHSIFLTDEANLSYWQSVVGDDSFKTFLLELDGNLFVSSDLLFPESSLLFENQVDNSKDYWKPKVKSINRKEYIFQGKANIIK